MKRINKLCIAFVVLLFKCNLVLAAGWSGSSKILEIYPAPGHNGVLIKHSSMPNSDNCASPTYYLLSKDNILFSEIYSLLMSAQARQSNINLQLVGCGGSQGYNPLIYQVIAN